MPNGEYPWGRFGLADTERPSAARSVFPLPDNGGMRTVVLGLLALSLAGCQVAGRVPRGQGYSEVSKNDNGFFSEQVHVGDGRALVGRGEVWTDKRKVDRFVRIVNLSSADIRYETGVPRILKISGQKDVIALIETKVNGGELRIEPKGSYETTRRIQVVVYGSDLEGVDDLGTGDLVLNGIKGPKFWLQALGFGHVTVEGQPAILKADLSGSGPVLLKGLNGSKLEVKITGSSDLEARGKMDEASITIKGSGTYDGQCLQAKTSSAKITGAGTANVNASDAVDVQVSGSGHINIYGKLKSVSQNVTGSGQITIR